MSSVMGTTSKDGTIDVEVYAKGETGLGIESTVFEYQVGTSSTTIPTGDWSTEIVTPSQGEYLWIKTTHTYTNGNQVSSYNLSYFSVDGGWYTPAVAANGDLSWTPSKAGMTPVETTNIKGPQGETGSLKFYFVNQLPTENIENDAFYVMNTENPTPDKRYDEYFYINNHWEKFGSDIRSFWKDDSDFSNGSI